MTKKEMENKAMEIIKKGEIAFILMEAKIQIKKDKRNGYSNDINVDGVDGVITGVFQTEEEALKSFTPNIKEFNGFLEFNTARVIWVSQADLEEAEKLNKPLFEALSLLNDGSNYIGVEEIESFNK